MVDYIRSINTVNADLRDWKARYMRRNSKEDARVLLRHKNTGEHTLELYVGCKLIEQYPVDASTYCLFRSMNNLQRITEHDCELIIIHDFHPVK